MTRWSSQTPHLFSEWKRIWCGYLFHGNDTLTGKTNTYDLIFLDENMQTKWHWNIQDDQADPHRHSHSNDHKEREEDWWSAIGSEMADYLIKPVKPNQILLTIRRYWTTPPGNRKDHNRLQAEFIRSQPYFHRGSYSDWIELYRKIIFWESELEKTTDPAMSEILKMQETDANKSFSKFITANYLSWLNPANSNKPLMSPGLLQKKVIPRITPGRSVFFILIDNMRYDQWKMISGELTASTGGERRCISAYATATQFSVCNLFGPDAFCNHEMILICGSMMAMRKEEQFWGGTFQRFLHAQQKYKWS